MLQSIYDLWQSNLPLMMLIAILIFVTPFMAFYIVRARREHPKGLIAIALSNMGERFGYYIMNAVLLLFLCSKFGISDSMAGWIYAVFYFLIYVLSLPGGIIADKLQNYKGTIIAGMLVMALGYVFLSVPIFSDFGTQGVSWILVFTCFSLFLIAAGNGLFKGNLQAIVGQMYDNFEAEAAKKGERELAIAKSKRDSGFQIFYVFINIGSVIAPFVAPLLRSWWLQTRNMQYNADLPRLCHEFLVEGEQMASNNLANLQSLSEAVSGSAVSLEQMTDFCNRYLTTFNEGVHFSFIASVIAMLVSVAVFVATKKRYPNPVKHVAEEENKAELTAQEVADNKEAAREVRQRMFALYAVLGVAVFFWFSFHQNGQSLSIFARDFVVTSTIPPEIWQCINPFFVIVLTPIIMWIFNSMALRGKTISTPRKIAIGMFVAGCAYLFLMVVAAYHNYPSGAEFKELSEAIKVTMRTSPMVLIATYFFLTVAELFISPLGLSFVTKVAPRHLQGICQGLWLSATAIGNLFIGLGVAMLNTFPHQWETWAVFAAFCLISMGVMVGMLKWLEKITN